MKQEIYKQSSKDCIILSFVEVSQTSRLWWHFWIHGHSNLNFIRATTNFWKLQTFQNITGNTGILQMYTKNLHMKIQLCQQTCDRVHVLSRYAIQIYRDLYLFDCIFNWWNTYIHKITTFPIGVGSNYITYAFIQAHRL